MGTDVVKPGRSFIGKLYVIHPTVGTGLPPISAGVTRHPPVVSPSDGLTLRFTFEYLWAQEMRGRLMARRECLLEERVVVMLRGGVLAVCATSIASGWKDNG